MDALKQRVLYALSEGTLEELAQLLDELQEISFQIPNKQNARPLQYEPGIFLHTNAIDYYTKSHPCSTGHIPRSSRRYRSDSDHYSSYALANHWAATILGAALLRETKRSLLLKMQSSH